MATAVQRVIATARSEVGYLEKASNANLDSKTANAGYNNWNKFAAFLDNLQVVYNGKKNGYHWCDCFVDYCFIFTFGLELGMKLLCQAYKGCGAGCTYSMQYYKDHGQFFKYPEEGDQIFFTDDGGLTSYHTGFVFQVANNRVYTVEGNTSSKAGVEPNGGCVAEKSYSVQSKAIAGYGRPDWTLVKEENEMTPEKFYELFLVAMAKYNAERADNDASAYSQAAREWAVASGLIAGGGKLADGSPNYMWEAMPTREQLVTILKRYNDNETAALEELLRKSLQQMQSAPIEGGSNVQTD